MRFSLKYLAILCLAAAPLWPAEDGAAIFKQRCSGCHGPDGSGQTTMGRMFKLQDLRSAAVQNLTDAQLYQIVADGKGKMPAFKNSLGKAQIDAVIAHLRQLAKTK